MTWIYQRAKKRTKTDVPVKRHTWLGNSQKGWGRPSTVRRVCKQGGWVEVGSQTSWQYMKKLNCMFLVAIFILLSCNNNKKEMGQSDPLYCDNLINLLSKFDSVPSINSNLYYIFDSIDYLLSTVYDSSFCGRYLPFSIPYPIDSLNSVKIALKSFYGCGCLGPTFNSLKNICTIILNNEGYVIFGNQIISQDSLKSELINFYKGISENNVSYPESLEKLNIMIHWDIGVSVSDFNKYVNQLINAYIDFVGEYSINNYGKNICNLNNDEIFELATKVPFNFDIPKMKTISLENNMK